MNIVWLIITLSSTVVLLFINPDEAIGSMTSGANKAVSLSLTLLAGYALWLGLFDLLEKTGLAEKLAKILRRPVSWLFPGASDRAKKFISMNIASNLLGLGNASTPMGINAVCAMTPDGDRASDDMKMLLILSSTSLQLIPSTVITLRVSHGSASPTAFLPACLIATVISTITGVFIAKLLSKKSKRKALPAKCKRKTA